MPECDDFDDEGEGTEGCAGRRASYDGEIAKGDDRADRSDRRSGLHREIGARDEVLLVGIKGESNGAYSRDDYKRRAR